MMIDFDRQRLGLVVIGLALCALFVWPLPTLAQSIRLRFQRLNVEHGLPQSRVTAITQDRQGFLWLGSEDGLSRFDGHQFVVYREEKQNPRSLSGHGIFALLVDPTGALWIGTDKGLNRYDPKTDSFTLYLHGDKLGERITSICADQAGRFWLGTSAGLSRFDPISGRFNRYRHDPARPDSLIHDSVSTTYCDRAGVLWITTAGGLDRFDAASGHFTHYRPDPTDPFSLSHPLASAICEDRAGFLWVATRGGGLNRLDRATGRFTRYQHDPANPYSLGNNDVMGVFEDSQNRLWVGTVGGGLNLLDRATGRFTRYLPNPFDPQSFSGSSTTKAIYEDRSGLLWFGSEQDGLNKLDPAAYVFTHYRHDPTNPHSLPQNNVICLAAGRAGQLWITTAAGLSRFDPARDGFVHFIGTQYGPTLSRGWQMLTARDGMLWIGTASRGLFKFDPVAERFTRYLHDPKDPQSLAHDYVTVLYEGPSGGLWINTLSGLNKYDPVTNKLTRYPDDPADKHELGYGHSGPLLEDRFGTLWYGSNNGGLDYLERGATRFARYRHDPARPDSLGTNLIHALYEDQTGDLWIGTDAGLDKFDRASRSFIHYRHDPARPDSLGFEMVNLLLEDRRGRFWVVSQQESGGSRLDLFDPQTGSFTHFTAKDGVPDKFYFFFVDADATPWFGHATGLWRFDPDTRTARFFDARGLLQSTELGKPLQDARGEFFLGGPDGLNRFDPRQIKERNYVPPIVLTAFRKFEHPVSLTLNTALMPEINLSYQDHVFSLEFAALDFSQPQRTQYAYKLDGFDADWIYSGTRRVATYTNLPGGKYILRVKATDELGRWQEKELAVPLTVTTAPWKRWWAIVLYVLMLGGMVVAAVRYRLNQLHAVNKAKTQFTQQLLTSQEQERKRIAAELHDGLGQSLLVIKNRTIIGKKLAQDSDKVKAQLEEISQATGQALEEVRNIAYNLRPYHLERLGLREAIEAMLEKIREATDLEINARVALFDEVFSKDDDVTFYRVIQECLNNIIKHAEATAVEISIVQTETEVTARIQDNGRGFAIAESGLRNAELKTSANSQSGGFGLIGLAERIRMLGGTHSISSETGKGTTILVKIPRDKE
jgi:signal transduction histidine kinase/ligand-binding sensor domain-containing protein